MQGVEVNKDFETFLRASREFLGSNSRKIVFLTKGLRPEVKKTRLIRDLQMRLMSLLENHPGGFPFVCIELNCIWRRPCLEIAK